MIADSYWRQKLSRDGQAVYDSLCAALRRGDCHASSGPMSEEEMLSSVDAVRRDAPQYFNFNPQIKYAKSNGLWIEWIPLYNNRQCGSIEKSFQAAVAACNGGANELDTEKRIAEYLVRSVSYAIDNSYNQNAASALHFKRAQCSGYASAVKYLCDQLGVWCIRVDGSATDPVSGNSGPHSWNIVCIGGKYYHLDVTSMCGCNADRLNSSLRYMYFNETDTEFSKTHVWDRTTVPACVTKWSDDGSRPAPPVHSQPTQSQGQQSQPAQGENSPFSFLRKIASLDWLSNANNKSKKTSNPFAKRTQPQATNTQSQQPPSVNRQNADNYPVYNSLSALRTGVDEAYKSKKDSISFILNVGSTQDEKMKLFQSSMQMLMRQWGYTDLKIGTQGEVITVYFK